MHETKRVEQDSAPACTEATLEVLETMFFELPVAQPKMQGKAPEPAVAATAVFSGDLRGSLCVACEPWAARRLAASFLGREDESTIAEAEVRLVACEMANMVCGNALSRIEPHGRFQIVTPVAS
ncbi:MAG TPA: chemotaxis protein CheX, partial [Bryobacteraceae bacterium]|nr:chemotaxis protein CheX [Bryobacteraceae bacterium]